jgi:predicted Zn-dependent protease
VLARHGAQAQALLTRQTTGPRQVLDRQARPERLLNAESVLQDKGSTPDTLRQVAEQLESALAQRPADASTWLLLSQLWQRLGQPVRAVRAEAEAAAALGDLPGAIDRAEGAQKRFRQPDAADTIELSALLARSRAWQRQQHDDLQDR